VSSVNEPVYPPARYAWYVVGLLTVIHMVAYVDRYILTLLIEPIKASLSLSDLQIGLLIGPAFIIFFVTLGLPLGWLADRKDRSMILGVGIALWSLLTAACGIAKTFPALFMARVGVGVGEASMAPCSVSLIGDYFPRGSRPRAIGLWMMGAPVGAGGTYLLGGQVVEYVMSQPPITLPVIGELFAWQSAFFIVGFPGLILAALMIWAVREPVRQSAARATAGGVAGPGIRETIDYFIAHFRSYVSVFLGIIGISATGASSFWAPALFERTWGWGVGKTGIAVGTILVVTGLFGTNFGGWLAARWTRRGIYHGPYLTVFIGAIMVLPAFVIFPLMPTPEAAVVVLFFGFLGMSITSGTSPSAVIAITPGHLRGQMTAVFFLVINLFGSILAPPMVGYITDRLGDPAMLKYGMSITVAFFGTIMIIGLWTGLPAFRRAAAEQVE